MATIHIHSSGSGNDNSSSSNSTPHHTAKQYHFASPARRQSGFSHFGREQCSKCHSNTHSLAVCGCALGTCTDYRVSSTRLGEYYALPDYVYRAHIHATCKNPKYRRKKKTRRMQAYRVPEPCAHTRRWYIVGEKKIYFVIHFCDYIVRGWYREDEGEKGWGAVQEKEER